MATATRTNTRPIAAFIRQSDLVSALAAQLKAAEQQLLSLQVEALEALPADETVSLTVDGVKRTAKIGEAKSYKITADAAEAVAFARKHGLKVTTQPPEVLASATLRSAAQKGLDVSAIAETTTKDTIIIG